MGAKLASPDWLSVNFIGDSGFGQTASDFETAVRLKLPILTVLVNNGVMGGHAERIEAAGDVRAALERGIEHTRNGQTVLLEFVTKEESVPVMANKSGI